MYGTFRSAAIRMRRSAVISACRSLSMAHGPPISASGAPPPIVTGPTWTAVVMRAPSTGGLVGDRRGHEPGEERVRLPRARAELRMELAGHEERMLRNLDELDELLLRPHARYPEAALLELAQVVVVHLVAVAVALLDDPFPVEPRRRAA